MMLNSKTPIMHTQVAAMPVAISLMSGGHGAGGDVLKQDLETFWEF
jgi:hypothetical protein